MNLPLELVPVETPAQLAAVARLYGEPLMEFPKDLYIPPGALEIILDAFEGPLDLLLYLIRKANLNVLDIPMAPLTAQYLVYVEAMRSSNLELAAEYLLMAAMLLEIKSRLLLPRPAAESEDDGVDPRAELVRRLLEYEQTKLAAAKLDAMPRVERDFEWISVYVAERSWSATRGQPARPPACLAAHGAQGPAHQHHRVNREELSVREHMISIMRRLQGGEFVAFDTLFDSALGVPALVVGFLAVLELVRSGWLPAPRTSRSRLFT